MGVAVHGWAGGVTRVGMSQGVCYQLEELQELLLDSILHFTIQHHWFSMDLHQPNG